MKTIGNPNIRVKNIQILIKVIHLGTISNPTQTCITNLQTGVLGHPPHHHPLHPPDSLVQYYPVHHPSAVVPTGQEVIITFGTPTVLQS